MKRIAWILLGWVISLAATQAEAVDCTQPLGKAKKFVRCGKAMIQADIPADARTLLANEYLESKILSGDLDQDGVNDFVVYATERTGEGLAGKVVILKGKSGGGYDVLAKSSFIQYGTADIEISKNSLFLRVDHNSVNESQTETYQFKYRDGGFFLIGKEEISYNPADESHGAEYRTSTNYLAGVEVETEKVDGKITAQTKKKIEVKLLKLENFSR